VLSFDAARLAAASDWLLSPKFGGRMTAVAETGRLNREWATP